MPRRLLVGGAAAVTTAVALLLGGVFHGGGGGGDARPSAGLSLPVREGASADTTLLPRLQRQVRENRAGAHGLTLLGLAYQQAARESGDPTYYPKSEAVLKRALRLGQDDLLATSGLGALALSRHQFRDALALGRRAVALSPTTARGHGIVGDALVELGRYEQAFAAFDRMVSLKPSLASYARVSYARELLGDIGGAAEAMQLAIDAATGQRESQAWAYTQLGKLYATHGRLGPAEHQYRRALGVRTGYVYAVDGLAQVAAARGRLREAISLERRAAEEIPLPQFVATLGDLLRASGDDHGAARQYALIGAIDRLLRANGVRVDLESALFDVDHGVHLRRALARAHAARADRPSIDGDDVLAWALARNGRCADALHYSKRALRLGTVDANKFFHRGMIERCLGNGAESKRWFRRALAVNPHFSVISAPVAKRYAA
jgi:tetratricopeptide (TPR) repeat protein